VGSPSTGALYPRGVGKNKRLSHGKPARMLVCGRLIRPKTGILRYVRPRNTRTEMYAGRVANCPWWVTLSCAARSVDVRKNMGRTDGRTAEPLHCAYHLTRPAWEVTAELRARRLLQLFHSVNTTQQHQNAETRQLFTLPNAHASTFCLFRSTLVRPFVRPQKVSSISKKISM